MGLNVNWNWPKVTALLTVQAGAQTAIGLLVGKDALNLDWVQVGGASGLSAVVAFLGAVVAYKLPGSIGTALVSAPVGAASDAADAVAALPVVPDANEARGK